MWKILLATRLDISKETWQSYASELLHPPFGVIDTLGPFLGPCVPTLESILERRKPGIKLGDTYMYVNIMLSKD